MQLWKNNAISTLSAGISAGDTTIFVQPSHGGRFPVVAAPDFALLTLEDAAGSVEILKITAHTAGASSMTVVRAQQGTTARSYIIGDLAEMRITAADFTGFGDSIADLYSIKANKGGDTYTGAHDFSGAAGVALPATTVIGAVSATEIAYLYGVTSPIQGQFAGLQAQLAGKGNVTGQNWSGAHVFNGSVDLSGASVAVVTRPVGTNDNTPASTAFVNAMVFASYANLPGNPNDYVPRDLSTFNGQVEWAPKGSGPDLAMFAAGIV